MPGAAPYTPLSSLANGVEDGSRKAKVLYDYDAKDATELSLIADEVCLRESFFVMVMMVFFTVGNSC